MKHIFIVNPAAGPKNDVEEIRSVLNGLNEKIEYFIYETKCPLDATRFVNEYCVSHNEPLRFYACGGDGTLNEVANGVVGHENAELACVPVGSGNDFVKYYGDKSYFLDIEDNIKGTAENIDLLKINDKYSINAVHFGFDSVVASTISKVKRKPIIGGKRAYTTGIIYALFHGMKNKCIVNVNGKDLNKASLLLCTLANGSHVGGSFKCAPRSSDKDGFAEVCLVKPVSVFTFLRLMSSYKLGTHLDDPRFSKHIEYCRGDKIVCTSPNKNFFVSIDGEVITSCKFTVEVLHKAIRFVVPKALSNIKQHFAVKTL